MILRYLLRKKTNYKNFFERLKSSPKIAEWNFEPKFVPCNKHGTNFGSKFHDKWKKREITKELNFPVIKESGALEKKTTNT